MSSYDNINNTKVDGFLRAFGDICERFGISAGVFSINTNELNLDINDMPILIHISQIHGDHIEYKSSWKSLNPQEKFKILLVSLESLAGMYMQSVELVSKISTMMSGIAGHEDLIHPRISGVICENNTSSLVH